MARRRQASMYITDSLCIESMRSCFNPAQARLIPAHVTLCREDEVADWDVLRARLESLRPFEITLGFDAPVRNDHFVFLPVREGFESFHEFRRSLLTPEPRIHHPHLTIIHPRNGTCSDEIFAEITRNIPPFRYTFREVMLIEQEGEGVWDLVARVGAT